MQTPKFAERFLLVLLISLLMAINSFAQRKMIHTDQQRELKAIVGILYSSSGGEHIRKNVLKTANGFLVVTTQDSTRYVGFRRKNAWSLGAQWRVIYRTSEEFGLAAESVTFTGRVDSALAKAEQLVREYLYALSKNDYRQAYAKLSSVARHKLVFNKFKSLYKEIDLTGSSIHICAYSHDKVTMFIALGGEIEGIYQQCIFVQEEGVWYISNLATPIKSETMPNCWQVSSN
jgi:hypothetical protein